MKNQGVNIDKLSNPIIFELQILFVLVHHYQRAKGVITSGCMFMANFILFVCSMVILLDALLFNGPMYSDFQVYNAYLVACCSAGLLFLSCFADDAVDAGLRPAPKTEKDDTLLNNADESASERVVNVSPRLYSSFLSRITYFWFGEFFEILSKKKTLDHSDLWELDEELKIENVSRRFNKQFDAEMQHVTQSNQKSINKIRYNSWNTIRVAWRFCGKAVLCSNLLKLVGDLITFLRPILLSFMIKFISNPEEKKWHGILLVVGFVSCSILERIFMSFFYELTSRIMDNMQAGMKNLLYSKATNMSNKARNKSTTGQIINLINDDVHTFSYLPNAFEKAWSNPLQIGELL